jgi:hypothetical protein
MMGNVLMLFPSLLALGLAVPSAYAQSPGSFLAVGNTLASAMMVRHQFTSELASLIDPRCL